MRSRLRSCTFVLVLLAALAAFAPAALAQHVDARLGALAHPEIEWARLLPSTPSVNEDLFGHAVAIDGDTAVVGMIWTRTDDRGSAFVFVRDGADWTLQAELTASDPANGDNFGWAVAVEGDTAVVSTPHKGTNQGAVYVFTRSGSTWTQQQKLTAADGATGDQFGYAVALSGGTILVGAQHASVANDSQGAVYAFTSDGTTWSQQQKLTASDGEVSDDFGRALALDGDSALIGSPTKTFGGSVNQGAAYVFARSGATWSQQQELTASDGAGADQFGSAVALSGDTAVVGAPKKEVGGHFTQGAVYVFTGSGATWTQQRKFTDAAGKAAEGFGQTVAIQDDTLAVGAVNAEVDNDGTTGAVFVYTRSWSAWSDPQKLSGSDRLATDSFGSALAMSGNRIIIGAEDKKVGSVDQAGEAYIFAPAFYSITPSVVSGHGDVTPGGVQTVSGGRDKAFTFAPDPGYHVQQVKVDGAVVTPTPTGGYTFTTVCDDHTVAVTFSPDKPELAKLSRKAGRRGTVIVLKGVGFGARRGTSYVKFGGVHCTRYLSWSDSSIKCKVPAKAKLGKRRVRVVTVTGMSNTRRFRVRR